MFFPMTDDEKIARDWINAVERNRVREADIYPQLKAWVHQISATDILDVGCGQVYTLIPKWMAVVLRARCGLLINR
jgi:hypothetical protein